MQTIFLPRARAFHIALAAIGLLLQNGPVAAQDEPTNLLIPIEGVLEDIERPDSLVNASQWMRGAYFVTTAGNQRPRLYGAIPADWQSSPICVRAVTIDGRYRFTAEYVVPPGWKTGLSELEYRTSFTHVWSAASLADSGVAITRGPCINGDNDHPVLVPALWNGGERQTDAAGNFALVLNLHARSAEQIVATATDGSDPLETSCTSIDRNDAEQFNYTCTISVPPPTTRVEFEYVRLNNGRASPSRSATLTLASAP